MKLGNIDVGAKMGNMTVAADLGKITIEAMQGIELKCGMSKIVIDQSRVTIEGMMVKVDGKTMVDQG